MVLELIEEQAAIPALPLTFQFINAIGALAPVGEVNVAVKVRIEPRAPPPVAAKVNVGVTWAIVRSWELTLPGAK